MSYLSDKLAQIHRTLLVPKDRHHQPVLNPRNAGRAPEVTGIDDRWKTVNGHILRVARQRNEERIFPVGHLRDRRR
jgi:hypothetical protein